MLAFWKINELNTSASARVTIASVTPRVRIAGSATSTPTPMVATTPIANAIGKPTPRSLAALAAAQAPNPASAYWHSESCPA